MKRFVLTLIMVLPLMASGCGKKGYEPASAAALEYTTIENSTILPAFAGGSISGTVMWYPGSEGEPWSAGLSHTYNDGAKSHTVRVETKNAYTVTFQSLTGLTKIDFSEFK